MFSCLRLHLNKQFLSVHCQCHGYQIQILKKARRKKESIFFQHEDIKLRGLKKEKKKGKITAYVDVEVI